MTKKKGKEEKTITREQGKKSQKSGKESLETQN